MHTRALQRSPVTLPTVSQLSVSQRHWVLAGGGMKGLQGVELYRGATTRKTSRKSHPGWAPLAKTATHPSDQGFGQHKTEQLLPQSHRGGRESPDATEGPWLVVCTVQAIAGHHQTLCPPGLPALADFSEGLSAVH